MRYVWDSGSETIHIQKHNALGTALNKSLCGRTDFNRSINAPFKLGKRLCLTCQSTQERVLERGRD